MRVRIVTYAPDALTRDLAKRIRARFSAEKSSITCRRYGGWLGPLHAWRDRSRGELPDIELDAPVGIADGLIVIAPLVAGRLAAPMRSFLERPNRIPPILGVVATRTGHCPARDFDEDVARLANGFGGPETLILSGSDLAAAGRDTPRSLAEFLDRLAPIVETRVTPVVLPFRAA
jgi:hypothetical protein